MRLGRHDPAHFRLLSELWVKITPGSEEADVAEQPAVRFTLDRPGAETVENPASDGRHQPAPAIFGRHRLAEVTIHVGFLKDRVIRAEVVLAPRAKDEAIRFDPRCFADQADYFLPSESPPKRLLKRAT